MPDLPMTAPTHHAASLMITPQELGDWAKAIGAISGVVGGAWLAIRRVWGRYQQRRALDRELRESQAELLCVLADRDRFDLAQVFDQRFMPVEERDRLAVLRARLVAARKRYWKALGFPESVDDEARAEVARLRPLRMTQRWKMRQDHPEDK